MAILAADPPSDSVKVRHSPPASENWAITWKRCKIWGKLLLITNRKSYMSFRLVPKTVTLNDLERRNGVTLRYFTEFGKHAFHTLAPRRSVAECTSLLYFVVRVRCRRTESSRSLSHLLMSFLLSQVAQSRYSVIGDEPFQWSKAKFDPRQFVLLRPIITKLGVTTSTTSI